MEFEDVTGKYLEDEVSIRNKKIKLDMKTNDNYMNWLEKFMERIPEFIEDDFESPVPLEIGKENAKYGKYIYLLYGLVRDYAKENYLSPNYTEHNAPSYVIKYHNNFYEIGEDFCWGSEIYCKKLLDYKGDFIDYFDIRNDTKSLKKDIIKLQLDSLANTIREYTYYIPAYAVIEKVEDTINDIKVKRIGPR